MRAAAALVACAAPADADPADRLLVPFDLAAWLREACDCGPGEAWWAELVESDADVSALATAVPTAEPAPTTAPAIATPTQTCLIVVMSHIPISSGRSVLGVTLAL